MVTPPDANKIERGKLYTYVCNATSKTGADRESREKRDEGRNMEEREG